MKIVVAVDFSNESYNALFYATRLFENQPCIFHIVNVTGKNAELSERESKEQLIKTLHRINLDNPNSLHEIKILSKFGLLSEVISKIVEQLQIDLVVIGNKGKTGAKEIFMGSNTIKLVRSLTQCPLLAVPKEVEFKNPKNIAFITDYKKGCNLKTLHPLKEMSLSFMSSIQILHIGEEKILSSLQASNKKLLEISLKDLPTTFVSNYDYSDKARIISNYLNTHKIDLLAMVYSKRSFIEILFKEPVIMDLSVYSNIPFLILCNRD